MHYTAMSMARTGMGEQNWRCNGRRCLSGGYMLLSLPSDENGEVMHGHSHHQILTKGDCF
jgi:hypothetical protein